MVEPTQDREGEDLATCLRCWHGSSLLLGNLLLDTLVRSCLVEVVHIRVEHAVELLLLQDKQMIETLAPYTAQKPFTYGIGSWRVIRRFQDLNAASLGNPREGHAKLAIVITDEVLRTDTKSGSLSKLLCRPSICGKARHADVDYSPRVQFDNEEGEQRTEEQVSHREEVASPDLLRLRL